jgi:hypothetical protein
MLNSSMIASIMNISADIYVQQNSQDPNTKAIIRGWVYNKTIQCKVEPVKVGGASTRGDNKKFGIGIEGDYNEKLQLKIKTLELLSKRWRIENIRTSDGKQIFVEIDKFNVPDTKFEVTSSHAVLDPFGKITYYEAVLLRTQVQDNDPTSN